MIIFESIKDALNIQNDDNVFDTELMIYLNTQVYILWNCGITKSAKIDRTTDSKDLAVLPECENSIVDFILINTKNQFDPPVAQAIGNTDKIADLLLKRMRDQSNDLQYSGT